MPAINATIAEKTLSSPADVAFAITAHDTNELAYVTRGVYVGTGGDITVVTLQGSTVLFKNVNTGTILPVRAKIVKATGTTASNLVGLT